MPALKYSKSLSAFWRIFLFVAMSLFMVRMQPFAYPCFPRVSAVPPKFFSLRSAISSVTCSARGRLALYLWPLYVAVLLCVRKEKTLTSLPSSCVFFSTFCPAPVFSPQAFYPVRDLCRGERPSLRQARRSHEEPEIGRYALRD